MSGLTFAQNTDGRWGYKVAGADPVIPFSKGAELLWTNPNSLATFAAQTISLDLSKYKYILISCIYSASSLISTIVLQPIPSKSGANNGDIWPKALSTLSGSATYASRAITVTTSGVTFENSLIYTGAVNNTVCIPYKIYGFAEDLE